MPAPFIQSLTGADERPRREALANLAYIHDPGAVWLIIDLLIDAVRRGGDPVRRRASVALASMGQTPLLAVLLAIHRGRSVPVRVCLAETVGAIGAGLDPQQRVGLFLELEIVRNSCGEENVALAYTRAIAVMGLGPVGRRK
jgi:HEAT repeat protein